MSKQALHELEQCAPEQPTSDDAEDDTAAYCPILQRMALCNRVLWHVGLQLRELTAPGELSLVRVDHAGKGQQQVQRSAVARRLFFALLTCHRCLVSVELDETLFEGSGLGEFRVRIVHALLKNTRLRTLTLHTFFDEYRFIQQDVFAATARMTHLRELVVSDVGTPPTSLVDAICRLLVDTTSLRTLTIDGLTLEDEQAEDLVSGLLRNRTVSDLSVHVDICHAPHDKGGSLFSRYLTRSEYLRTLRVRGTNCDRAKLCRNLMRIAAPIVVGRGITRLELVDFELDNPSAYVLSGLLGQTDGSLRHLDISGCYWKRGLNMGSALSRHARALAEGLRKGRWGNMASLSLNFEGFTARDCELLFSAAAGVQYLRTVAVTGIEPEYFPEVCQAILDTGMSGRVRVRGEYTIDRAVLGALEDFPEELRQVIVSNDGNSSARSFRDAVRLVCTCYHVTELRLLLMRRFLRDVPTMRTLQRYLSQSAALRGVDLVGCGNPDLSGCIPVDGRSHSALLEAIFANECVAVIQLRRFRFGEANWRFIADAVLKNRTLSKFSFSSKSENQEFARCVAQHLMTSNTLTRLYVPKFDDGEGERFVIEFAVGRNLGLVTCAAHFVTGQEYTPRTADALLRIYGSAALTERIQELLTVEEADARRTIRNAVDDA
ncbi:hypothetical protein HPB50_016024 [Hyalomma asiaticum]|uniref:Uncharacterized protein n=1 Tax=Hyalomma asiaticum TaxID=266040 RepID=A0ACB7T859_HYAAI|nr:hypothetical protein HPB50_016024 [Hyalomma asiaticum]